MTAFARELKEGYGLVKDAISVDLFKSLGREAAISAGLPTEISQKQIEDAVFYSTSFVFFANTAYQYYSGTLCHNISLPVSQQVCKDLQVDFMFKLDHGRIYRICHSVVSEQCEKNINEMDPIKFLGLAGFGSLSKGCIAKTLCISLPMATATFAKKSLVSLRDGVLYVQHNGARKSCENVMKAAASSTLSMISRLCSMGTVSQILMPAMPTEAYERDLNLILNHLFLRSTDRMTEAQEIKEIENTTPRPRI